MQSKKSEPLELVDWRKMPSLQLLAMLAGLATLVVCGPALVKLLFTGLIAELALLTVLLVPSMRLLFGAELPQPAAPRLDPAPPRLRLTAGGQLRRGRVRGGAATVVRSRNWRGVFLWRLRASDLEIVGSDGRRVRVCGALQLEGEGKPVDEIPEVLALPEELPVPPPELMRIEEGDEVELCGPLSCEQAESGYRDTAEVEVMRGVPGDPIRIRLL